MSKCIALDKKKNLIIHQLFFFLKIKVDLKYCIKFNITVLVYLV